MKLPRLDSLNFSRSAVTGFGGYNHNNRISEGEWYDEENLSAAEYPLFSVRKRRGLLDGMYVTQTVGDETSYVPINDTPGVNINAMTYNNGWAIATDNYLVFYKDGHSGDAEIYPDAEVNIASLASEAYARGRQSLVNMGAYVILYPARVYFNTVKQKRTETVNGQTVTQEYWEYGTLDHKTSIACSRSNVLKFCICNQDIAEVVAGTDSGTGPNVKVASDPPLNPSEGDYWITNTNPSELRQYSSEGEWEVLSTAFQLIKGKGIAEGFKKYQAVTIDGVHDIVHTGIDEAVNGKSFIIYDLNHDETNPENDWLMISCEAGVVSFQKEGTVTFSRKVPVLDYVFECGNRLWGCHHGVTEGMRDKTVNEIYVSALGDPCNWNNTGFDSTSRAAVISVGSSGPFTGAVSYQGYPTFFKEDCVYKIYGSAPSQYQTSLTSISGVARGAGRSLTVVDDCLYYLSDNGVMRYDGTSAVCVSSALGGEKYVATDSEIKSLAAFLKYSLIGEPTDLAADGACGGTDGRRLFMFCLDKAHKEKLFVYDTKTGIWHREDAPYVLQFYRRNDELYYIEADTQTETEILATLTTGTVVYHRGKRLRTLCGTGTLDGERVKWFCESGVMGTDEAEKKYVSRITARMQLTAGSRVMVYVQYDSDGDWRHAATVTGTKLKSFSLPVKVRRCDHFRIKFIGEGDVKIYSIVKDIETGGIR